METSQLGNIERIFELITKNLNTPVLIIILIFTFIGYKIFKNKGWNYLLYGWLFNLIYLHTESINLKKDILGIELNFIESSSISIFTAIFFSAFVFCSLGEFQKKLKIWTSHIIGITILLLVIVLFKVNTGEFFPDNPRISLLANLFMPHILYFFITISLSAFFLHRFLTEINFKFRFWITTPWLCYAILQFTYYFKFLDNKKIIIVAFALALLMKSSIAFGLILLFKYQTELATLRQKKLEDEEEKYKASTWQREAFSWFSHELKNPIFSIRNASKGIFNTIYRKEYRKALNNSEKLIDMTNILANVIESVKIASEPLDKDKISVFSLNDSILSAIQIVKNTYSIESNEISTDFASGLYTPGIKESVVQIFVNLIKNAYEASDEYIKIHGPVEEKTRFKLHLKTWKYQPKEKKKAFVVAEVIDFGAGIPKKIQELVFEPYYSRKKGINRGLGLWIVRNFTESFGGRIELTSPLKHFDRGTSFKLFFPKTSKNIEES